MVYPAQFEVKVGFDLIRQHLKDQCAGTLGQQFVDKLQASFKYDTVLKLTTQTKEMVDVLGSGADFTFGGYYNILPLLRKAEIENAFLDQAEWNQVRVTVVTIAALHTFFQKQPAESFPELKALGGFVGIESGLVSRISQVIDDNGQVRDSASTELQQIRRNLIKEQTGLRRKLDTLLKSFKAQDMVAEDAELTIRSGRLVIPLRAEQKRQIKGFVHDESATGQTVFIEPAEVVESNNAIRELTYEERREIIRILTKLTNYLRPQVPSLIKACTYLGMLDFIRAKARFAQMTDSIQPPSSKQPGLDWYRAKHPLLHITLGKQGRTVTPLDIKLDGEQRILIISGPNAGGKSIALKSVALIQYMWQSGLLVPMQENSQMGLFDSLFIDIGDEQSLENDLSTYSSHLKHMLYFTKMVTKRSLFLIDEMGTGTEPQYGGAIAETILEELNKQQAFGVVNTHYGNLKELADRTKGMFNGAMRFDAQALTPLYQLEMGKPGSSFALEIARKIGFMDPIIKRASSKVGQKRVALDQMLLELEASKQQYETLRAETDKQLKYHTQYAKDYNELKALLEQQKKQVLAEAKLQAKALVQNANQKIEQTIREIKESQANRDTTKTARQTLQAFVAEDLKVDEAEIVAVAKAQADAEATKAAKKGTGSYLPKALITAVETDQSGSKTDIPTKPKHQPAPPKDNESLPPLGVGSYVRVADSGAFAQIIAINGKDVEIGIGDLKSKVKLSRLTVVSRRAYEDATGVDTSYNYASKGININDRMAAFSFNLDLRGKRGTEALTELDQFIDSALLLGQQELRILHGKGDGILRNLVRQHLKAYKQIKLLTDEHADRGGDGITLVSMQ